MEIIVDPDGAVRCIYAEDIDLATLGEVDVVRASHVEPDSLGAWWADLAPVSGPKIGPFTRRSQALEAEAAWLAQHWLCGPQCAPPQILHSTQAKEAKMQDHRSNESTRTSPTESYVLNYRTPVQRPAKQLPWVVWLAVTLIAICLIAVAWRVTRTASRGLPSRHIGMAATQPSSADDVTEFYHSEISPLLDASHERNRQAADRAIAALHERFNAHRHGVKAFAEDVSGWRTRFGVIGRFTADQWDHHIRGDETINRVDDYIQEKFRVHILSEQSLQADVQEAIKQLEADLQASRNQLFAEIKLPLHGSHSPIALDETGWENLCKDIVQRAQGMNATIPRDSVATGLAAVAGGWIGTEAGEAAAAQVLARVGGAVAVEAAEAATAAGGSAMAGGSASGGGIGAFGGPAGTVIGVGVGLAVGAAIEWWMTARFEAQLTELCDQFLDSVENQILDGNSQTPGLRGSFEQAIKLADERQRKAIVDALLEEAQK